MRKITKRTLWVDSILFILNCCEVIFYLSSSLAPKHSPRFYMMLGCVFGGILVYAIRDFDEYFKRKLEKLEEE